MKSILCTALYLCSLILLTTSSANAEQLQFQPGQTASYVVTQTFEIEAFKGVATTASINDTLAFDVKILSLNPETLSYPIDVELTFRRVSGESTLYYQNIFNKPKILKYDSNSQPITANAKLAKKIATLIDAPLRFTVNKDFDIKETTGLLSQFEKSLQVEVHGFLATPAWNINLLLTQLFHLAGENLEASNSYPVSSWQILVGDDVSGHNVSLSNKNETSRYTINSINANQISATWKSDFLTQYVFDNSSSWLDSSSSWSSFSNWTDSLSSSYSSDYTTDSSSWSDSSFSSSSWSDSSEYSSSSDSWYSSSDWSDDSSSTDSSSEQVLPVKTSLSILSNIIWDRNNPLKQNRYFKADIKAFRQTSSNPLSLFQGIIQQTWEEVSP